MVVAHAGKQRRSQCEEQHASRVHGLRAGHVDEAAEGRAGNDRGLRTHRCKGERARQHVGRHQRRHECLLCWHLKRLDRAQQHRDHEQQLAARPMPVAARCERSSEGDLRDHAERRDARTVKSIDDMAGDQHQQQRRQELQQADQAQIPGVRGQVVHLPAHGHHQHLVGAGAREPRVPKPHERREGAQRRCCRTRSRRRAHRCIAADPSIRTPG